MAEVDLALFDLDRTLLDCNSGRLWMMAEWKAGFIGVRDVAWASWWLARYAMGSDEGLDQVFQTAVASLMGSEEAVLDARVDAWFEREVRHRLRPGARDALLRHREAGHRLVLATSSTQYVARRAVDAYGLDHGISTTLAVDAGRFTGGIAELAVGAEKLTAVRRWADREGVALERCAFYTDSYSDVALMEAVGEPVAVHPDRRLLQHARARGWRIEKW